MARPIIGILLDYEAKGSFSIRPHYALRTSYFDAIWKAGGTPIAIPYLTGEIKNYVSVCRGFLFPGGFYPFPDTTYSLDSPKKKETHPRYQFESALIRLILKKDLPILGICAGMQLIGSILGSKMFKDISAQTSSNIDHLNAAPAEEIAHDINITPGSLLYKILGVKTLSVNTAHKESLREVSPSLLVNAVAPDGIVEGVEAPNHSFCLGVQWHPEFFAKEGDPNFNLFKSLVSASTN